MLMTALQLQSAAARLFDLGVKTAKAGGGVRMAGTLYLSEHKGKPWLLLTAPAALVRGVFSAMTEPGIELPPSDLPGRLQPHITVFRPEEIAAVGGPDKFMNDRGKSFHYTLGGLTWIEPGGWPEMSRAYMLRVSSPELQALRRSYGLSSLPNKGKHDLHLTVAVKRRGVLGSNETSKNTVAA